jgi:predicted aminopeptidase
LYSDEIRSALRANAESKILVVGQDDAFNGPLQNRLEEFGIRSWEATSTTQPETSMIIYDSNSKDRHAKSELLTQFATDKRIRVMMGPITPLSEGKNLQMCDHLFILDTP